MTGSSTLQQSPCVPAKCALPCDSKKASTGVTTKAVMWSDSWDLSLSLSYFRWTWELSPVEAETFHSLHHVLTMCLLPEAGCYLPTFNEHLVFISPSVQSLSDACIYVQGLPQHLQQSFTMASENCKLEFWQGSYKEEQAKTHSLGCLF